MKYSILLISASLVLLIQQTGVSMENIIRFDNNVYNLVTPQNSEQKYIYISENDNIEKWHSQICVEHVLDKANSTEASAEYAHKVQSENPGASVLVYPEAATVGVLTFPSDKQFYEYNAIVFKNNNGLGLKKITFAKRFYADENGGVESARVAAIAFAEDYNKKYMELLNRESAQIGLE